jgi:hypothetical protein
VHAVYLQSSVKSVNPLIIIDLNDEAAVWSLIDNFTDVRGETILRYVYPEGYMIRGIELNDPNMGALISPE